MTSIHNKIQKLADSASRHPVTPASARKLFESLKSVLSGDTSESENIYIADTPATNFATEQWYALHNNARGTYIRLADDGYLYGKSELPSDQTEITTFLFRFIQSDEGYLVEAYNGKFWKELVDGSTSGAGGGNTGTGTQEEASLYTVNSITPGHFYLNDGNGVILDNNGPDYAIAGWQTGDVTTADGNNDWQLIPIDIQTEIDHKLSVLKKEILEEVQTLIK